ncbi:YeeE/YedE family protein [soil metagenome]
MDFLLAPWPWYIAGPIIGLTVPLLLLLGNKSLGISSTLRQICAVCIAGDIPLFNYNWKKDSWNLLFALGLLLGGFLGGIVLRNTDPVAISSDTSRYFQSLGITDMTGLMPVEFFNWRSLLTIKGFLMMVVGGFLVGFGTRYARGCTSGHGILGLSALQWPSLVAIISFFAGGILFSHYVVPLIFAL